MVDREEHRKLLVQQIREIQKEMTDEERVELWNEIVDDYCPLCGSKYLPCYCAPCYDE